MSVQFDSSRSRWVVSWYDGGRQRCRRFAAIIRGDGEAAERAAAQHVLPFEAEIRQVI
jgi:DNA-binding GntR family transcriptional regulator